MWVVVIYWREDNLFYEKYILSYFFSSIIFNINFYFGNSLVFILGLSWTVFSYSFFDVLLLLFCLYK